MMEWCWQIYFGIENDKFEFGSVASLQVDNKKILNYLPVTKSYWDNEDHIANIDLTFTNYLRNKLKEGYNLKIENNNYKINVNLSGFTAAYDLLRPRNECN